jgi:hypothetical protein
VGGDCEWLLCFATSAYRQPLPRFPSTHLPKLLEYVPLAVRARMYMHGSASVHFSRVVRDDLNNTYHEGWLGRGGPTAYPPRLPDLTPLGTPRNPGVCSSCWHRRSTSPSHYECLLDSPQLLRHLWTDVVFRGETCRGVQWISWRTFWALIVKYSFSYNSQMKCFWARVDMDLFSCFGMWNSSRNFVRTFQLHSVQPEQE